MRARYRSPYGTISSEWRVDSGRFLWDVSVPPNATATLQVPAASVAAVTEGGRPLDGTDGIRILGRSGDRVALEAVSGRYHFMAQATP